MVIIMDVLNLNAMIGVIMYYFIFVYEKRKTILNTDDLSTWDVFFSAGEKVIYVIMT